MNCANADELLTHISCTLMIKHYCDCALCESMISLHGPRFWILPEYIS